MQEEVANYYLKVEALTEQKTIPDAPVAAPTNPLLPLISIILVIIATMGVIMIAKIRELHQVITVFGIALMIAAIPVGMSLIRQSANISSKAAPDSMPLELSITRPTKSDIEIKWMTNDLVSTHARLSETSDMKENSIIHKTDRRTKYHKAVFTALDPEKTYYLEIISGSKTYALPDGPIEIKSEL